ncbi:MAG: hypothetical protein FWF57_05225 [Defluviitaleaceae bacterium]|nr:hypothetical protein [Defluviitaleaceae bacterium]
MKNRLGKLFVTLIGTVFLLIGCGGAGNNQTPQPQLVNQNNQNSQTTQNNASENNAVTTVGANNNVDNSGTNEISGKDLNSLFVNFIYENGDFDREEFLYQMENAISSGNSLPHRLSYSWTDINNRSSFFQARASNFFLAALTRHHPEGEPLRPYVRFNTNFAFVPDYERNEGFGAFVDIYFDENVSYEALLDISESLEVAIHQNVGTSRPQGDIALFGEHFVTELNRQTNNAFENEEIYVSFRVFDSNGTLIDTITRRAHPLYILGNE